MRSSQISVSQLSKFLSKFQRPKNSELSTLTHKNFVCDIFCEKHVHCKLNRCKIKCVVFMFISVLYLTTYCEVQASKMAANLPDHPETSQAVRNRPKTIQADQKFFRSSKNSPTCLETFESLQKLSRLFAAISRVSDANAQKLSGWHCLPSNQVFCTI